ncbi:MAG: AAA family ATPase [Candidatus Acidiferrales bacterium]
MFLEYYQLREQPFGVTPDPRFLYFGPGHREALASLIYAVESRRGFSAMIAEPGMGKTTLLFRLLETLRSTSRTAFLFQTEGDSRDLLRGVLADLGIPTQSHDLPTLHEALNAALLEEMRAGRQVVIVLDEAQNLDEKSLESVRMLSNFETSTQKLMHIVLAGQPKLGERLAGPDLKQLRQRVSTIIRLDPFTPEETEAYIDWRLRQAGYQGTPIFMADAIDTICRVSKGVPRNINSLCFQALSIGFATGSRTIGSEIMREVVEDLDPSTRPANRARISTARPVVPVPAVEPRPIPAPAPALGPTVAPGGAAPAFRPRPAAVRTASQMPTTSIFDSWAIAPPPERSSGLKRLAIAACVVVPVMLIVGFSLPRFGITAGALAAKLSGRAVSAGLGAGGSNSDLSPTQQTADPPQAVPPVTGSNGATSEVPPPAPAPASSQAVTEPAGTSQSAAQSNVAPETHAAAAVPAQPAPLTGPAVVAKSDSKNIDEKPVREPEATVTSKRNSVVQVTHRENLFEFALENYGKSSRKMVDDILELNPHINGPYDMLKAGEWIQLPGEPAALTPEEQSR